MNRQHLRQNFRRIISYEFKDLYSTDNANSQIQLYIHVYTETLGPTVGFLQETELPIWMRLQVKHSDMQSSPTLSYIHSSSRLFLFLLFVYVKRYRKHMVILFVNLGIMVLKLDGNSEHSANVLRKEFSYLEKKLRFVTALHLNKCLKQIKYPRSLCTCAPIFGSPPNRITKLGL